MKFNEIKEFSNLNLKIYEMIHIEKKGPDKIFSHYFFIKGLFKTIRNEIKKIDKLFNSAVMCCLTRKLADYISNIFGK